mgnify:CR=1 FL=1
MAREGGGGGRGRIEFKILSREEMNVLFFFVVQN